MAARALGQLYVVATPIGNLQDLTMRAAQVLRTAPIIACEDTRRSAKLLAGIGVSREALLALHDHNEAEASARALAHLRAGRSVALITDAGTPLICDPGFVLVREAWAGGFAVTPVPGVSAITAALAVCPLPAERFRFEGFLPPKAAARRRVLAGLVGADVAVVFFEAPHRLRDTLADLLALGAGERPLLIGRELTKRHETIAVATVAEHLERAAAPRGEFCCVLAAAPRPAPAADAVLDVLASELSPGQAARLAARITGQPKAALYDRLLAGVGKARRG